MTDDPGPTPTMLTTDDGVQLETVWDLPDPGVEVRGVAVLTHPHPLYGGDLHNIVPASLARALPQEAVATVRINFRGAGASSGEHGGGSAEVGDVRAAVDAAWAAFEKPVFGVGYSFGADVLLALDHERVRGVVAVAPPLAVLDAEVLAAARGQTPTLILAAEHDQFCDATVAVARTDGWADTSVVALAGTDHFMAGASTEICEHVSAFARRVLGP